MYARTVSRYYTPTIWELATEKPYMKFILAARRKPEDTQEKYFYEWSIIHVALMITNPSTQRAFTRYAQHYTINGVSGDLLWHPLSPMGWDNMADHWLDKFEDLAASVRSEDYIRRMQPHKFGDSNFVVELTDGRVIYEAADFQNGGVKLIQFLKVRPGLTQEEFDDLCRWCSTLCARWAYCASTCKTPSLHWTRSSSGARSSKRAGSASMAALRSTGSTASMICSCCVEARPGTG